jgi:hypothetical protein
VTRDLLGGGAWHRDARSIFFVHRKQDIREIDGEDKAIVLAEGVVYDDKATHGRSADSFVSVRFNADRMAFELRESVPKPPRQSPPPTSSWPKISDGDTDSNGYAVF